MSKLALITGGSGFVGTHLIKHLKEIGWNVEAPTLPVENYTEVVQCIRNVVEKQGPIHAVIHLAALSSHHYTETHQTETYQINLGGTAHMVKAIVDFSPDAHFVFPSTAQVYRAPHPLEEPTMTEEWPVLPRSAYAQTKLFAEAVLREASRVYNLKSTVLRVFNHTHRTQSPEFFLPHIYSEILKVKSGERPPVIEVGDLSVKRDIGAVVDLVGAFRSVLEHVAKTDSFQIFNVCSGKARKLQDLASLLAQKLDVQVEFHTDTKRLRPNDATSIKGSFDLLHAKTGWKPSCETDAQLIDNFLA